MEDWSGVYLRQTLGLPALLGASGVAVYHAAMAVGRLCTARVVESFGNHRTLLAAGSLVAGGMAVALATREPVPVVVGFLVVGFTLSAVTPIAFSLAGDLAPNRAGGASSVVAALGYSGFLVGPAVVGGMAELFGLRVSLGTVLLAGGLIFVLARWLEGRKAVGDEKGSAVLKEALVFERGAALEPDFWFRTRPNSLAYPGQYGRLHVALQRAHRLYQSDGRETRASTRDGSGFETHLYAEDQPGPERSRLTHTAVR